MPPATTRKNYLVPANFVAMAWQPWSRGDGSPRLTARELQVFTTQLSTMLNCGLGLAPSLDVLSRTGHDSAQRCAQQLLAEVEKGLRVSEAMRRLPGCFPINYRRIIQTAEATGRLGETLDRLGKTLEMQNQTLQRLGQALVYPAFLVISSVSMLVLMVYFIFPMVLKITADSGVQPPALTRAMMWVSAPQTLGVACGLLAAGAGLLWWWWRHPRLGVALRSWVENWLPPGRFFAQTQVLNSVRQLATMLESGVDLLKAITYAGQVGESSLLVGAAFEDIARRTRMGESLADSFARHEVFPHTLSALLSVSDEAGDTHTMLAYFADMLEERLNTLVDAATALIEPLLLAAMGVAIGLVLAAAFLPIYALVRI